MSWRVYQKLRAREKKIISKSIRSTRLTQQSVIALDHKGLKKASKKAEAFYQRVTLFSCISFICSEHQGITNLKPSLWGFFC